MLQALPGGGLSIDTLRLFRIIKSMDKGKFSLFFDEKFDHLSKENIQKIMRSMQKEHTRLIHLLDHISQGVLILTCNGSLLFSNEKGKSLLGLSPEQKNISRLTLSDGSRPFSTSNEASYTESKILEHGHSMLHLIIEPDRTEELIYVFIRDVTDIYRTRRLLVDNLQSTGHLVNLLNAEINDSLTRFRLFLDLLPRDIAATSSRQIEIIEKDLQKTEKTLSDLALTFISNPHVFRRFPPDKVLRRVIRGRQFKVEEKSLRLDWNMTSKERNIFGNSESIEQAFSQMLDFAIEESPEGGQLLIETSSDKDFFSCSVSYEGGGLFRDELYSLFDPLFPSRERPSEMGLSLAAHIFAHHLSSLNIKSRPGEISRVTASLPLREESQPSLPYGGEHNDA